MWRLSLSDKKGANKQQRILHGNIVSHCVSVNCGSWHTQKHHLLAWPCNLLVIQETHVNQDQVKAACRQCREAGWSCYFTPTQEVRSAGVAMLWRSPIKAQRVFSIHGRVQAIIIDDSTGPFLVINVYGFVQDEHRNHDLYAKLLEKAQAYSYLPHLYTGDWNAEAVNNDLAQHLFAKGHRRLHPADLPTCQAHSGGAPTSIDYTLVPPSLFARLNHPQVHQDDQRFLPRSPLTWTIALHEQQQPLHRPVAQQPLQKDRLPGPIIDGEALSYRIRALSIDNAWEFWFGQLDLLTGHVTATTQQRLTAHHPPTPLACTLPTPHKHWHHLTVAASLVRRVTALLHKDGNNYLAIQRLLQGAARHPILKNWSSLTPASITDTHIDHQLMEQLQQAHSQLAALIDNHLSIHRGHQLQAWQHQRQQQPAVRLLAKAAVADTQQQQQRGLRLSNGIVSLNPTEPLQDDDNDDDACGDDLTQITMHVPLAVRARRSHA